MSRQPWVESASALAREIQKTESRPEAILLVALWGERAKWRLVTQYQIGDYRVDIAIPEAHIAIEVDGHEWHRTNGDMVNDLDRQNAITYAGWTVLRFPASRIFAASGKYLPEIVREVRKRVKDASHPPPPKVPEPEPLPELSTQIDGGLYLLEALSKKDFDPDSVPLIPRRRSPT